MNKIIDTNVPIIANGDRSQQMALECRLECIRVMRELIQQEAFKLVIDLQWNVLGEYQRHLTPNRDGGLGDQFLQWVLNNRKNPNRCVLVQITEQEDSFVEFPNEDERLTTFDPADRKWIAVALAHQREYEEVPPIVQAADMKWKLYTAAFGDYGISIEFICERRI